MADLDAEGETRVFWKTGVDGGKEWTRIAAPATKCSRIPKDFLENERAQGLGDSARNILCEFVGDSEALFDEDLPRSVIRTDVASLIRRGRRTKDTYVLS